MKQGEAGVGDSGNDTTGSKPFNARTTKHPLDKKRGRSGLSGTASRRINKSGFLILDGERRSPDPGRRARLPVNVVSKGTTCNRMIYIDNKGNETRKCLRPRGFGPGGRYCKQHGKCFEVLR